MDLDGLATSVTLLVMTFFALVSLIGHSTLQYFVHALAGALLGFLKFNAFKHKFLWEIWFFGFGGAVAAVAMILKLPLLVIIVGGIYVVETLSVIIQVLVFKAYW